MRQNWKIYNYVEIIHVIKQLMGQRRNQQGNQKIS